MSFPPPVVVTLGQVSVDVENNTHRWYMRLYYRVRRLYRRVVMILR